MVFGLALLWAWLNMPIPIYGTLWLLALAYFTVMLLWECAPWREWYSRSTRALGVLPRLRRIMGLSAVYGIDQAKAPTSGVM